MSTEADVTVAPPPSEAAEDGFGQSVTAPVLPDSETSAATVPAELRFDLDEVPGPQAGESPNLPEATAAPSQDPNQALPTDLIPPTPTAAEAGDSSEPPAPPPVVVPTNMPPRPPTDTPLPAVVVASDTPVPPVVIPPTNTSVLPTDTALPPVVPTNLPPPTVAIPTDTSAPPPTVSVPTNTPLPAPTDTPLPPPTNTPPPPPTNTAPPTVSVPTEIPLPLPTDLPVPTVSTDVTICHIPPNNPSAAETIMVGPNAVAAHLAHGDTLGPCP